MRVRKVATQFADPQIKRVAEAVNAVADFDLPDHQRDRTAAEIAAGVTPVNYQYPPGDVRRYGAVGDGVTDDTAALEAADKAMAGTHGAVVFEKGKTYLIESTGVTFENASVLEMNGATIKGTADMSAKLVLVGKTKATYDSFTPFTTTAGSPFFTIPTGVTLVEGDVVRLQSDTDLLPGYKHGMQATVIDVTSGTATLNRTFYGAFQVDEIAVLDGSVPRIVRNGKFDIRAAPNVAQTTMCLEVIGRNVLVEDCVFYGSRYAGIGCNIIADGGVVARCQAYGFINPQGISSGRLGYGYQLAGSDVTARDCLAYDCKHGFTAGDRRCVTMNVTYDNCTVYEDKDADNDDNTGSIDIHANGKGEHYIKNCRVYGRRRLLFLRCPNINVIGGEYVQVAGNFTIIGQFEGPLEDLLIKDIVYKFAGTTSNLIELNDGDNANYSGFANVTIEGCRQHPDSTGGGFVSVIRTDEANRVSGLMLRGNHHVNADNNYFLELGASDVAGVYVEGNKYLGKEDSFVSYFAPGDANSGEDIVIRGNKITREGADNAGLIEFNSTVATRLDIAGLVVDDNVFTHESDTGTGHSANFTRCNITSFSFKGNTMNRADSAPFRAFAANGCVIENGRISGNVTDSGFRFLNTVDSTELTNVSVTDNVGETFSISTTGEGVTLTRFVFGQSNNFNTATPNDAITFASGDATPSVKGGRLFTTANGSATTITDFDDGYEGQEIVVIIGDANTTVDFTSSGLKGNGGADWSPGSGDFMRCTYNGTDWYCQVTDTTA